MDRTDRPFLLAGAKEGKDAGRRVGGLVSVLTALSNRCPRDAAFQPAPVYSLLFRLVPMAPAGHWFSTGVSGEFSTSGSCFFRVPKMAQMVP